MSEVNKSASPTDSAFTSSPDKDAAFGAHNRRRIHFDASDKQNENFMDKSRKNLQAYEYLCHIGEAKEWIEAVIRQQLPPVEALVEELRNGIYLAYLAKEFDPTAVKKIFEDRTKLQFKHSDNINFLLQAMRNVHLPPVFYFELTDLYDKKNIPKVIYCIHALSHLLAHKGLVPQIKNLVGKLRFTDDVLDQTQAGLDESGLVMPSFGDIGTHLKNELTPEDSERIQKEARNKFFKDHVKDIKKIQKAWKENRNRKAKRERLAFLKKNENRVIKMQAARRGKVVRDQYKARIQFFKKNLAAIVKIQSWWKGLKGRQAYQMLSSFNSPSASVLKTFLHLLDDSKNDYKEEIEVERLRQKVVKSIRENMQTETDLGELDNKIALLVKNRISLEVVANTTSKKMRAMLGTSVDETSSNQIFNNLKGHDKETKYKISQYQHLFYLLQTEPVYLARLMFQMNKKLGGHVTKLLERNVMALFGYAQNAREEYLLLQLIVTSIKIELASVEHLSDFWRSNPFFIKLVLQYSRVTKESQYIRDLFQPLVKEVFAKTLDMETDALLIYKVLIRNEETYSGQKTTRDLDISMAAAAQDADVKGIQLEQSMQLIENVKTFLSAIMSSLKAMPFGIRYIAMQLMNCMKEVYKGQEEDIIRSIGNLVYYRYMNPAIVSPEIFDVIEATVNPLQRKNLGDIAKILHRIAVKKPFTEEEHRPKVLNDFIAESGKKFAKFLREVAEVQSAEEHFDMFGYTDIGSERKPVIYISAGEIYEFHRYLNENLDFIAPSTEEDIRKILTELGAPPPELEGKEQQSNGNEIPLILTNQFAKVEEPEMNLLIRKTKRLVITIIQIQDGKNLLDILEAPVTQKEEAHFMKMLEEERHDAQSRSFHGLNVSALSLSKLAQNKDDLIEKNIDNAYKSALTFAQLKANTYENMDKLEELKLVSKANKYQDILNDIAKDMLNKHRRRRQRGKEIKSLMKTESSLEMKAKYMEEQKQSYHDYISACMAQLGAKKTKAKGKTTLFSKQYFHLKGLQKSGKVPQFGSFKYDGEKLHKKGVLVSVEDCSPKQYDKISFTISSDEAGVFDLEASFFNLKVEKQEIRLEELLQYQYEDVTVIPLFDGAARVNVNLLVYLINKK